MTITSKTLAKLTTAEKQQLLALLLESLCESEEHEPIPDWHRVLIRERLARMKSDPQPGIPADKVFSALKKRLRAKATG